MNILRRLLVERKLNRAKDYLRCQRAELQYEEWVALERHRLDEHALLADKGKALDDAIQMLFWRAWSI